MRFLNDYDWHLDIQELQVMIATVLSNIWFTFCKGHDIFNHIFLLCHLHPHTIIVTTNIIFNWVQTCQWIEIFDLTYAQKNVPRRRRKSYPESDIFLDKYGYAIINLYQIYPSFVKCHQPSFTDTGNWDKYSECSHSVT